LSEQRNYRKFSAKTKAEIVIAGLRGDRSVRDVCREHGIAETLYYQWREKLLEGGQLALAGKDERQAERELRQRIRELERALGRKTYELRSRGKHCGAGSEGARRAVPRPGRPRLRGGGGGAPHAGHPSGDLHALSAPLVEGGLPDPGPGESERVVADLLDTMDSFDHCVGLVAPQVDELVRIVVVDVSEHPKATISHGRLVLVSPRVVSEEGAQVAREGCLSIPHLTANVRRATRVVIEARDGARVETEGFEARCLLHEIDHLDGILFLDRVDSLATDVFRRRQYD
jgi:peptide deformylase